MSGDKIDAIRARHNDAAWRYYELPSQMHDDRALLLAEVDRQRAEIERLRDVLRRVSVHPSGDRIVKISFISEGCMLTFPVVPSTTWSLGVMIEFDKARREALEGKP